MASLLGKTRSSLLQYRATSRKVFVMKRHESRTDKKPLIIKVGNTRVKVYQGKSRGYDLFTVTYYANGERKRETFGQLESAKCRASEVAILTEKGQRDVLKLSSTDRESYVHAMQLLAPLGVPLHAAVEEYVSARAHIGGDSLLSAAKDYSARHRLVNDKRVAEIVNELIEAKTRDGRSKRYVETLRSHLNRFAASFQTGIGSVTTPLIEAWLHSLSVGPRARNNMRTSIVTLFRFARAQNYLAKGQRTEVDDVSTAKDNGGAIGILQPKQMAHLMRAASGKDALYFALGGFAGIRSAEIIRLEWKDFNFVRGHITIAADKAKTATRRLVPILPNLAEWLRPYHRATGKLFRNRRDADSAIAFAKGEGIKPWPDNCLRHSFATYRLAAIADAGRVSLEMGNSPKELIKSYRELADEQDATAWFAIAPKKSKKVIPFAQSAISA